MQGDLAVGLDLIAGNANLTFIFFVAFVVQAAISVRFAYYAERNRRSTEVGGQSAVWGVLVGVGLTGGAYAVLGILDVASSLQTAYRNGVILAHVALLAMAMRALRDSAVRARAHEFVDRTVLDRLLWALVVAIAAGIVLATAAGGVGDTVLIVEAVGATAFLLVGGVAGLQATGNARVSGTVLDTVVRHLLPVLLFGALVPLASLAVLAGLSGGIVLHVQVVFLIMAATTLMTATITLRQNLAGI